MIPDHRVVPFDDLSHDDDGRMLLDRELFTGVAVAHWPDGSKRYETPFVNGVIDGWKLAWFPDGKKQSETCYVRGNVRGTWREWYPGGALKREQEVGERGVKISDDIWDEAGNLVKSYRK